MSLWVILLSVVLALLGYFFMKVRANFNYWQDRGIPCEKPDYILGSLRGARSKRTFTEIWDYYYKHFKGTGPFAGFYWFQQPAAFVLEPSLAKLILIKDFNKFTDRNFFSNEKDDPLTGNLFLLNGHRWRSVRNKLSPTFTAGKMKYMFPTVQKVGDELLNVLSDMVEKSDIVELKELLARFTIDVIGTCAFGIDCNSLKDPEAEFRVMCRKASIETRHGTLGLAFMNSFPELAQKLRMKQTADDIEEFFLRIVRETVELREKHNIRRNDFMDLLIDLKNNKGDKEVANLTQEQVAAHAFAFFTAGFETTSTAMGFVLYELAQHEELQQRARIEINQVLERYNHEFNYESIKEMEYLDRILSETLRLHTILPILNRVCLEDYVVPGNPKYVIRKGMPVIIPGGPMQHDADYYPNPEVFNPDNFLAEKVRARDSVLNLSFGDGPRNCIGMRFGQMQARLGVAILLKSFHFSTCPQTQIPIKYNKARILVSPESGIYLRVVKI